VLKFQNLLEIYRTGCKYHLASCCIKAQFGSQLSIHWILQWVNTIGTVNMLNYARTLNNLERFVYFSTDEVFGPAPGLLKFSDREFGITQEIHTQHPKAGGEEFAVRLMKIHYDLPIYITHTTNVFGQRQHPEKFIPMCIRKIRGIMNPLKFTVVQIMVLLGSRYYIHATDVADALMHILTYLLTSFI